MANRYFFDKRVMKRGWLKYFIIFLISALPMVLFNIFVGKYISERWLIILLDCVILLVFVAIGNAIANRIYDKKDRKLEARIRARDEMNERKRQILEDSYNLKRIEKQKLKAEKLKAQESEAKINEQASVGAENVENTSLAQSDKSVVKNGELKKENSKTDSARTINKKTTNKPRRK